MSPADSPEIGRDVLDAPAAGERPPRWLPQLPRRRAALGLGASPAPALPFVLLGILLGPTVIGVLSPGVLARLEPVVAVALAMLGVFIGLGLTGLRSPEAKGLLPGAILEAVVTIAVVSGATYLLLARWNAPIPVPVGLAAAVLGICSCASAATRVFGDASLHARRAARVADLDDVALILLGTLAVGAAAGDGMTLAHAGLTLAAGLAVGVAGWLLFERAHGSAERGVFVTGAVLLLGGIGSYLGSSPLLSGCAAAVVWVRAPGAADRIIASDLRKLQHPLVALLLIIAGAWIQWTLVLLWIAAPLVLFRLSGKLLASAAAARITGVPAGLLATVLVPPGVIGIALALNVHHVLGAQDALLLSAVTLAAAATELLAAVTPGELEDGA